jgi:hypothetical protein
VVSWNAVTMSTPRAPRIFTESALQRLAAELRKFLTRQLVATHIGRIRLSSSQLGSSDEDEIIRQQTFFQIYGVVESFVDALLLAVGDERGAQSINARSTANWDKRKNAYLMLGIDLTSLSGWDEIEIGHEVRNSIAHGLGFLTPKQRLDQTGLVARFHTIDVTVTNGYIIVPSKSVMRFFRLARCFIEQLDLAAR